MVHHSHHLRNLAIAARENAEAAKRLAEISETTANAAKASADALVNAERPWITATVRRTVKDIPVVRDGMTVPNSHDLVSYFDFVLTNHGRTPAEIFAVRAKTERTKKGVDGGLASDMDPDYGLDVLQHVKLLAPGAEWVPDLDTVNLFVRGYSDLKEIRNTQLHLIFWGVVLYRDQFRPDMAHETRFCYTYLQGLDDYRPSGPRQYTKYT
jgi:hypothetical protein